MRSSQAQSVRQRSARSVRSLQAQERLQIPLTASAGDKRKREMKVINGVSALHRNCHCLYQQFVRSVSLFLLFLYSSGRVLQAACSGLYGLSVAYKSR